MVTVGEDRMSLSRFVQPRAFLYIDAIAKTGSIRRAAEDLNVA